MPIALVDLLDERLIRLDLRAADQGGAIRELVEVLAANGKIDHAKAFADAVIERERTTSTLAENAVAFPHARTNLVDEIVLAIGRSEKGIPWPDVESPAQLIFLIGVPQKMQSDYLVVVGTIARTIKDDALRTLLVHAENIADFIATMQDAPSI